MAISREKLYEEVWLEPMTTVAARYSVSSSFLARVCERLKVPRPPRGYWAMLAVSKAPARPPLLDAQPGDELEWSRDGDPRSVPRELPKAPERPPRRRPRSNPERPSRHGVLVGIQEHFDGAKQTDTGYLRPSKRLLVDVFVSRESLGRALDLANELFLALEDRGHRVVVGPSDGPYGRPVVDERSAGGGERFNHTDWRPARPTIVFVGTVGIGLTIFELSHVIELMYLDGKYVPLSSRPVSKRSPPLPGHAWTTTSDLPSGRLCVRASSPYPRATWEKQWRESKPGDMSSKVASIVRALEAEAPGIAELFAEGERQAEIERQKFEEQHRRWQREEAERRRVQNTKERGEELFAIVEAWAIAKRIEGFFEEAEQRAATLAEEERRMLVDRLHRARELLGGVDALQRFRSWRAPDER